MNAIQKNHQLPTPPTRTPGKNTIDSIFCSNTLLASKCGYLPFQSNYDHRPTWIDVPYTLALGHKMPPVVRPQMRRLQLSNKASKEISGFTGNLSNSTISQPRLKSSSMNYPNQSNLDCKCALSQTNRKLYMTNWTRVE